MGRRGRTRCGGTRVVRQLRLAESEPKNLFAAAGEVTKKLRDTDLQDSVRYFRNINEPRLIRCDLARWPAMT